MVLGRGNGVLEGDCMVSRGSVWCQKGVMGYQERSVGVRKELWGVGKEL